MARRLRQAALVAAILLAAALATVAVHPVDVLPHVYGF